MLLGREIDVVAGDIVLDGDPAPPPPRDTATNFRAMSAVAERLGGSSCLFVR